LDAFNIPKADDDELYRIAKQRICNYPLVQIIFTDGFIRNKAIKNKHDLDNMLLYWLVGDNPFIPNAFQELEENLELLQTEGSIRVFRKKLRQWKTIPFESTITEIELAAEYKRRGYAIEFEPILPNGRKAEFIASKDSLKIFFEIKRRFPKRFMEENAITNEFLYRFHNMEEPFVIRIELEKSFHRKHTDNAIKYIKNILRRLETTSFNAPYRFYYKENGVILAIINIDMILPKGDKGGISGFNLGGDIKKDWSILRNWIASAINQLHPNHPGVLVIQPYGLRPSKYDIENALLGDLRANGFRMGDSILAQRQIERLSAVIYIKKVLQEWGWVIEKFVYHNAYAKRKLSIDVFKGDNVIQFIPKKIDNARIEWHKI